MQIYAEDNIRLLVAFEEVKQLEIPDQLFFEPSSDEEYEEGGQSSAEDSNAEYEEAEHPTSEHVSISVFQSNVSFLLLFLRDEYFFQKTSEMLCALHRKTATFSLQDALFFGGLL